MKRPSCLSVGGGLGLWLGVTLTVRADALFWRGGTGTWENAINWTNAGGANVLPSAGDDVSIGPASEVLLSSETPLLASFVISGGTLIFTNWTTRLIADNVTIQSNAIVTVAGPFWTNDMSNRVWIVCTNFMLISGGRVGADGKGYLRAQGPGAGSVTGRWGGGGHGGKGGWGDQGPGGGTNGSVHQPMTPGSGGADGSSGGAGGGVIWIEASGTADVRGVVTVRGANASNSYGGGGSGGAIFLRCGILAGTTNGLLSANGGNGGANAGGGGGGRIAVDYQDLDGNCAIRFSTAPGVGWGDGDPANRGWFRASGWGTLSLPNGDYVTSVPPSNRFDRVALYFRDVTNWAVESLTIEHNRLLFATPGLQMTVWGDWRIGTNAQAGIGEIMGDSPFRLVVGDRLVITNAGLFSVFSGLASELLDGFGAEVRISNEMHIAANSRVVPYSHWTNGGSVCFFATNLTISAGGSFYAQGCGYAGLSGSGAGVSGGSRGSGGGHGGWGGWTDTYVLGGPTNGSLSQPMLPGSGGGSLYAFGGGVIALHAVHADISGILNANGLLGGNMGGGAGGAILLKCETLSGISPLFMVNGGDGSGTLGGGGGGGRIALHVQSYDNLVSPRFQARRGNGMFEGVVSNTWQFVARDGTLWLSNTGLLSTVLGADQFRDLHLFAQGFTTWTVSALVVSNNSFLLAEDGFRLVVQNDLTILTNSLLGVGAINGSLAPQLDIGGDLRVLPGGRLEVYSAQTNTPYGAAGAIVEVQGDLVVETNGWIIPYSHQTNGGSPKFKVNSARIHPGGGFFAVGRGFQINAGPGKGVIGGSGRGSGGGYGGKGGNHSAGGAGGPTNGIILAPYWPGSGGGNTGGNGGGVIWIEATGLIQVDGHFNADGARHGGNMGGGAGGGILLVARDIRVAASGLLSAAGGDAGTTHGGGGGGGRIALWRNVPIEVQESFLTGQFPPAAAEWVQLTPFARFEGIARVPGGIGWQSGDPGTVRFVDVMRRGTLLLIR